jgi:hypothetical protein
MPRFWGRSTTVHTRPLRTRPLHTRPLHMTLYTWPVRTRPVHHALWTTACIRGLYTRPVHQPCAPRPVYVVCTRGLTKSCTKPSRLATMCTMFE